MLKDLLTGAARFGSELLPEAVPDFGPSVAVPPDMQDEPVPAPAVASLVSDERFAALVEECELGHLMESARRLAVRGLRFQADPSDEPEANDWTRPLAHLLHVDLGSLPESGLPAAGGLDLHVGEEALRDAASDTEPVAVEVSLASPAADSVAYGRRGPNGKPTSVSRAVRVSAELTLPRAWAQPVRDLRLAPQDSRSWEELRERLATEQGVELADDPSRSESIHRLLGYPDERAGAMPLWCELLEQGEDMGGEPPFMHPRARELEQPSRRWRLLLQASRDPQLGWRWGPWRERLYVWVLADDLRAGRLGSAWAFVQ